MLKRLVPLAKICKSFTANLRKHERYLSQAQLTGDTRKLTWNQLLEHNAACIRMELNLQGNHISRFQAWDPHVDKVMAHVVMAHVQKNVLPSQVLVVIPLHRDRGWGQKVPTYSVQNPGRHKRCEVSVGNCDSSFQRVLVQKETQPRGNCARED